MITIYNKPETENSVAIEDKNIMSEGRADIIGKKFSFVPSEFQSVTNEQKQSLFGLQSTDDHLKTRKLSNQLEYEIAINNEKPKDDEFSTGTDARRLFAKKPEAIIINVKDKDQDHDVRQNGFSGFESLKITVHDI